MTVLLRKSETTENVACICFSQAFLFLFCLCYAKSLPSCPTLLRPHVAHQPPLSMGFSRQEYWSGLLFLLQRILGLNPRLLHCRQILYHQRHLGSPHSCPLLMKSTLSRGGGSVGMSMAASTINTWMEMVARQQPEESSSSLPQVLHIMVLYSILEVGQLSMKCW